MRVLRTVFVCGLALMLTLGGVVTVSAQQQFTGYQGDDVDVDFYEFNLRAGQTINALLEATSGDLDPYLVLYDPNGVEVAENDDRDFPHDLNAEITYTAATDGLHAVMATHIVGTAGNYRLTVTISGDAPPVTVTDPIKADPAITDIEPGTLLHQHTGYMGDDVADYHHEMRLQAGQAVIISAEATSGNLDTYLIVRDSAGVTVAENDDRDFGDLDAEIIFIVQETDTYTIIVTNISGTSGQYRLTVTATSVEEAQAISRVRLSGPVRTIDTPHFRIHYTLEGEDATTEAFALKVAETMEEVYMIQVGQLGWPPPPPDRGMGGDDRYDVYLANILDGIEGHDLGYASPELPYGDNPNNPAAVQTYAAPSYIVLDNAYSDPDVLDGRAPVALMRATAAHEFHHAIQFGYDISDLHTWYYEATSTWMETITFPLDQDATGYVELVLTYPEVCLGAEDEADPGGGLMMYGEWLFIQSLADAYGDDAPKRLWERIAEVEGWEALELMLADHGDTIFDAVARYRVQNLVRDYAFTPHFAEHTVWLEAVIDGVGNWTYTGEGIQELAANYFELALPPGSYHVQLRDDSGYLRVWAVGIRGDLASAMPLGKAGTVSTVGYDDVYLIVMSTEYDDELWDCTYRSYSIDVSPGTGAGAPVAFQMNASQFQAPQ